MLKFFFEKARMLKIYPYGLLDSPSNKRNWILGAICDLPTNKAKHIQPEFTKLWPHWLFRPKYIDAPLLYKIKSNIPIAVEITVKIATHDQ